MITTICTSIYHLPQGVYANVAPGTQGQGVAMYRPGKGTTELPPAQQGRVTNIPVSSKPIQVEKR